MRKGGASETSRLLSLDADHVSSELGAVLKQVSNWFVHVKEELWAKIHRDRRGRPLSQVECTRQRRILSQLFSVLVRLGDKGSYIFTHKRRQVWTCDST